MTGHDITISRVKHWTEVSRFLGDINDPALSPDWQLPGWMWIVLWRRGAGDGDDGLELIG